MKQAMIVVSRQHAAALATVSVAALALLFGVYMPQARKAKEMAGAVTSLQSEVGERTAQLQATMTAYAQACRAQRELVSFRDAVPAEDRLGEFLESLDRMAQKCGLSDKNVTPAPVMESAGVSCLPVEMTFSGGFEAVYEFLRRVESLPRVARVQRMDLAVAEDDPGELISSVTMYVYYRPT